MSSPHNAPKNGPNKIPRIFPVKRPAKTPIVLPIEPALLPPALFVKSEGTKLFNISTMIVTRVVTISKTQSVELFGAKKEHNSPAQQRGVPGKPGIMQPITPIKRQREPTIIITISKVVMSKTLNN